jgi:hypothetical protein
MRRTIRKTLNGKEFHLIVEHEDGMLLEFSGSVDSDNSHRTLTREATDDEKSRLAECYAGPADERLPADVLSLPIGRREDFVDAFNSRFYWYYKEDDEDYDENVSKSENMVRYALAQAYHAISKESESDLSESFSGPNVQRIQETFVGGIPFESFKESRAGGLSNEITVIEKGWSLNGNHYGQEALKGIAEGCNSMAVGYFNHGPTFSRDPRDWAIVTESGRVEGNRVKSKIHVFQYPDGDFLKERIEYAKNKKANHLFGVSIDAFAEVREGEMDGEEGVIVDRILRLNSVDIVMVPAAKGNFQAAESVDENKVKHQEKVNTMEVIDVKTLKESHPDTAKLLIEEGREEVRTESADQLADLRTKIDEKEAVIEGLNVELAKSQAKLDEYVVAEEKAAFEAEVKAAISEGLDEEKRTDKFQSILLALGADKMSTIKEMIAERQESVVSSVIVGEGKGEGNDVIEAVEKKKVEESADDEEARLKTFLANSSK